MTLITEPNPESYIPKIFYGGMFDYSKLYKGIAQWFNDNGYEFHDELFKHKVPLPKGVEQEFKVYGWYKVDEYVQIWIRIHCHTWEVRDVEFLQDGQKKKLQKGKIMIRIEPELKLDYNSKFNGVMGVKVQSFLNNVIWYKRITGNLQDTAYYRSYKLHLRIKELLNMSTAWNASDLRY